MQKEKCTICGKEWEEGQLRKLFTGRVIYMCPECCKEANKNIRSRDEDMMRSYRGRHWYEKR